MYRQSKYRVHHYNDIPFGIRNCKKCDIEIANIDKDGFYLKYCDRCFFRVQIEAEKEKRLRKFRQLHPELYDSQDTKGRESSIIE